MTMTMTAVLHERVVERNANEDEFGIRDEAHSTVTTRTSIGFLWNNAMPNPNIIFDYLEEDVVNDK